MQLWAVLQQVTFHTLGLSSTEIRPTEQNTHMLQSGQALVLV